MPCWEINTVSLAFKAKNIPMMKEVLKEMGIRVYRTDERYMSTSIGDFDFQSGMVEVREQYVKKVNDFRKKYAFKAIETMAKKKKWVLQKRAQNKMVAKKW